MVYCSVKGCKENDRKRENAPLHRFPVDKTTQKIWIEFCYNTKIKPGVARVCGLHFTEEDYVRNLKYELLNLPVPAHLRTLRRCAVPTLRPPPHDGCSQSASHSQPESLSQLEVHQSPRASFTDDQEAELAEWLHKNPLFYNTKLKLYKDAQKKQRLMAEKAKELNVEVSELNTWYSSMRTRYAKLNRKSGSGAMGALTERDSWIVSAFSFMLPYIVRCPTRSSMVQPAAVPVPATQAIQTNGVIVEEGVNDPRLMEEHTPSPMLPFQPESTAAPRPKRARQRAADTAGAVAMTADTLLEEVQERAESLSRVQEKLEKVLAPKSDFQEEVESFMHVLGRMALRLDVDTWMDVQQTLLAEMSEACREAQRKRQQQTPSSPVAGPSAAATPTSLPDLAV
ncbi:uncharacterized protein LOC126995578 isoform X4 [Eriocheir sinensis]|uniref:uncharacterized protein LOC126995578 isoform X4 n=1 Tax=Eriocheir sinensis TaxID=95602 RepID=UPI0021C6F515|nr:uncharacterized protein LOC126995578 isoform X4 [Eriocheir sinensis]